MDALKTTQIVVGLAVEVTTTLGDVQSGTVYAYSTVLGTLVLQVPSQAATGNAFNYKFFKTSQVKNLTITSRTIDESKVAQISPIDVSVLPSIIQRNKENVELAHKTRNLGASVEGQAIFNAVYKTMPNVSWKGNSIIVLEEVQIDPPYRVDKIKSILEKSSEESDAISLVKKIVDGVWMKLESDRKGG